MIDRASTGVASWPRHALPRGTTVNGYTIEHVLGSGGFGVTYLARDDLGQLFAVKEYFPQQFAAREDLTVLAASDEHARLFEDCLNRFRREAHALVRLSRSAGSSAGVVRVVTYFTALGTGYLVMEFVEGATLADLLRREPNGLKAERVRSLVSQLLSSVAEVHSTGLFHCDIKPANIILREDGSVVLIDFGASREDGSGLTRTYTQIYSAGYAPIEQMVGLPQGPFSDIYAIGAVCYHAIGGKIADALTRHHALSAGKPDPLPSAGQVGAGRYPPPLLQAIDAALTVNPEQRPQSVAAMLTLLGSGEFGDDTIRVLPSRPAITARAPASPRRAGRLAAALFGALALAATAYFVPWRAMMNHGPNPAVQSVAVQPDLANQVPTKEDAAKQEAARAVAARQEAARQAGVDAVNACDSLAASPDDQTRPTSVTGVWWGHIDTLQAIPACERAVADHPTPRLQFQLGRSYSGAGRLEDAEQLIKLAADQGLAVAQYEQGIIYEHGGSSVGQSLPEAVRLFKLAADQGSAPAQHNLGHLYKSGHGVAQSWTEAARLYRLAADQGYPKAQICLGDLYRRGLGVAQSRTEAVRLYKLAADQLSALAQQQPTERATSEALDEAARAYRDAVDQGDAEAQYKLGLLYEREMRYKPIGPQRGLNEPWPLSEDERMAEAARLYKLAADQGYAPAQDELGWLHEGGNGVNQSWSEARRLYELAADKGDAKAEFHLGTLYERGVGVKKSWTDAARFYKLAADQGYAPSQRNLAELYENGHGVSQSWTEAVRLYKLAADQCYATAQYDLGWLYETGHGVEQSSTQAARLYKLAADQGYAPAQDELGWLYEGSNGVNQSWSEARRLYELAALQGDPQAASHLGMLYEFGEGVKKSWPDAARFYKQAADQGNRNAQDRLRAHAQ